MKLSKNHNSLGLDVIKSPSLQDVFQPIPGLISSIGMPRNVGTTYHVHAVQVTYTHNFL